MKQNIIMIVILVALFFFGLLIYDFSDELNKDVTEHDWYKVSEEKMTVLSFKDNKFSYYYEETGKKVTLYELCTSFRYNRSINVVKLNCSIKGNKLYITSTNADELVITIDGEEKTFYSSKKAAEEAFFRKNNNMSDEDFENLMNFDFNKFTITTIDDINELYKSKNTKLVAIINKQENIKNALNLRALYNLVSNTNKPVLVLIKEDLSSNELIKLNKLNSTIPSDIKDFNLEAISIFTVGNNKFDLITEITVNAFSEVNNYNNI